MLDLSCPDSGRNPLLDTASGLALRPYQSADVEAFERNVAAGIKRLLYVAPTGAGKTVTAAEIIKRTIAARKKVLFIAHRDELLTQAREKLRQFDIVAGIIKSGRANDLRPLSPAQIAGIQTLHARAIRTSKMELPEADLVIFDEAHHIRARTYQDILAAYPNAIVLGPTATPCRGDGRGLGNVFEKIIEAPQIAELIKLGYLVKPKIYAPPPPNLRGVEVAATGDYVIHQLSDRVNTDVLVGDLIEHWLKHAGRRRTIVFAVDVAHSVHIARDFVRSGVRAEHVDGSTPQEERQAILARLASGETEVVSNCMILTEGFDLPDIGCIGLARPTRSLGLFRQMIGRGLRPAPGKNDIIILDHSGGVHRHGRPDDHIEWTLDTDSKAQNKAHAARIAEHGKQDPFCECTACGHLRIRGESCDNCGWEPRPHARDVEFIDGDLVLLGEPAPHEDRLTFYRELRGFQASVRKRDGTPYAQGWSAQQYKSKFGSFPPWSWNNRQLLPPSPATLRWIQHRRIAYARAREQERAA
jgi:DNA repair protein RadD